MHNQYPLLSFLLLLVLHLSNAQVTEEGGPPLSGSPSAGTVTLTDSVAPSGATPSSYYPTLQPQGTVVSSDSTSVSSSDTKAKVILGVVLSLSILFILVGTTLFVIRRRKHKASLARTHRASWLSNWVPEPKPSSLHHQNQGRDGEGGGTPPPTKDAEYPFALNMSTQKPPHASPLTQDV